MEKFTALMSRKVGGVPVGLIAVLVAAGLLYMAFRMRPTPEPVEESTDAQAIDGDLPDTSVPVFSATPTIMQPSGIGGPSVSSYPQEDTNELWQRRVMEWLLGGGVSYSLASRAIGKYLDGDPLDAEERSVRDKAVRQFGLPPESIPYAPDAETEEEPPETEPDEETPDETVPPPVTPPVPGTPPPPVPGATQGVPPLSHKVKGTSDNSPRELAVLYYGKNNAHSIDLIAKANKNKGEGRSYDVGDRIFIPKWRPANDENKPSGPGTGSVTAPVRGPGVLQPSLGGRPVVPPRAGGPVRQPVKVPVMPRKPDRDDKRDGKRR